MTIDNKWKTFNGVYSLSIEEKAWRKIEKECKRLCDHETGGVLIGFYAENGSTAVVKDVSGPPSDSVLSPRWFRRGIDGLKELLAKRWVQIPRTYYIGEWHYHPSIYVEPSVNDIDQMHDIRQSHNYHCREPIMIIVGMQHGKDRTTKAFVFPCGESCMEFHKQQD